MALTLRPLAGPLAWLLLGVSATAACAAGNPPPPPPAPPPPPDINSEAFQKELADRQAAALAEVSRSGPSVRRSFIVGKEHHYGFYFRPPDELDELVMPDFADERVVASFWAAFLDEDMAQHVGQRLICECVGVEWSYYSQRRFLVREAKLSWVP